MTPLEMLLLRLAKVIQGWERAEGIRILQAWVSVDTGAWQIDWIERRSTQQQRTRSGGDLYRAGANHIKVGRLIEDIKETAKEHGITIKHLIPWGGGGLQIWYDDAGRQRTAIYDPAGDRPIAMARATRAEVQDA